MTTTKATPVVDMSAEALLGSLLIDPSHLLDVAEIIEPGDFYLAKHGIVYQAILDVWQAGGYVDYLTVSQHLVDKKELEKVGGPGYLAGLINAVPSSVHCLSYAESVGRAGWLRKFADLATETIRRVYALDGNPNEQTELYAWIHERLQHMSPRRNSGDEHILFGPNVRDYYAMLLNERANEAEAGTRVDWDWYWASWQRIVRPMRPGEIAMLTMPDAGGKTTYFGMVAEHWAGKGKPVYLYHLENSKAELIDRRTCRWAGVELAKLELGTLTLQERNRVDDTQARIDTTWGRNLHYADCPGWTMGAIIADMKRRVDEGAGAFVIDYFDKCQPDPFLVKAFGNKDHRDAAMLEQLKIFAEQAGVPVFTGTQLRKSGKEAGLDATRNDMSGTGDKSNKAQLVILADRQRAGEDGIRDKAGRVIAEPGEYSPVITVTVDKQNRGRTGRFRQYFDGARHRVLDPITEGKP